MNNYMETIMLALEKGTIKGGLLMPQVAHDSWCKINKGKECNCHPEISVETDDGLIFLNDNGSIKNKI